VLSVRRGRLTLTDRDFSDAITLVHLPEGPSAYFKLTSVELTKQIFVCPQLPPFLTQLVLTMPLRRTIGPCTSNTTPPRTCPQRLRNTTRPRRWQNVSNYLSSTTRIPRSAGCHSTQSARLFVLQAASVRLRF